MLPSSNPATPNQDAPIERPRRILVVDDEPVNCDVLSRRLSRFGYDADTAIDGAQALSRIAEGTYDLVLLDIMMPHMNGLQVLSRLRETYSPEQLPVIMVTAMDGSADVANAIEQGANDYVVKPVDYPALRARMNRHLELKRANDEKDAATRKLRGIVKARTESLNAEARDRRRVEHELRRAKVCLDNASDAIFGIEKTGAIMYGNHAAAEISGLSADELRAASITDLLPDLDQAGWQALWDEAMSGGCAEIHHPLKTRDGRYRAVEATLDHIELDDSEHLFAYLRDVTARKLAESELQQARKLEAIGQLAAGIAHEINTPLQFVGDNTSFLQSAFDDLLEFASRSAGLIEAARGGAVDKAVIDELEAARATADLDYLREEIPQAIEQSLGGIERVTGIVRAMKEFSHPGSDEKQAGDLNQIVRSAATVSTNEWKYVAELELDLDDDMPSIPCYSQELSQVLVNLLVNAAHAIESVIGRDAEQEDRGTITVSTRFQHDAAEIRVSDTGSGIPEEIRDRILDPFFTTKEVGKGTGQGLTIAYSTVVDKHGGHFSFESTVGSGTTFVIRLPATNGDPGKARVGS